jgi:hypothetical protein
MARVTKKTYAALMSAKDYMKSIREMTQETLNLTSDLKVTNAYHTAQVASEALKAISEIAECYINDFSDVDPRWRPEHKPDKDNTLQPAQSGQDEFLELPEI